MDKKNHYKFGLFYYNKEDMRFVVDKANGLGWTINFAHKGAVLALIASAVLLIYFSI